MFLLVLCCTAVYMVWCIWLSELLKQCSSCETQEWHSVRVLDVLCACDLRVSSCASSSTLVYNTVLLYCGSHTNPSPWHTGCKPWRAMQPTGYRTASTPQSSM